MANMLPAPEKLDLEGDNASVGLRWEKWKRSLEIYLEAADIKSPSKKRATLLLLGGTGLQDIFYNLPCASAVTPETDEFQVAVEALDNFFRPKQNKTFERHVFRLIKQDEGESFEKFLVKLRDQASKCKFDKPDDHIIDQIIERCQSSELRKKILIMGETVTLDKVITEANTLEVVNQQLSCYEQKIKENTKDENVNSIINRNTRVIKNDRRVEEGTSKPKCGRCGNFTHSPNDLKCPAKEKKCHVCGKLGHYQRCCKTKSNQLKRKIEQGSTWNRNNLKRLRQGDTINSLEGPDEEVQYVFNVSDDATIDCNVGNVKLEMLIDSGCKLNLITDKAWEYLKNNKVNCCKQIKEPNKMLMAYGCVEPLQVKGSFEAVLNVGTRSEKSTIYVIQNGTRNLLGKDTALRLGVLKLGLGVNQIREEQKPFPKFKDILVEIPIDKSVKPVMQPYRRIPIPIEKEIQDKINELLFADIIEEVHEPSSWISPIVPILKDNGEVRLCIDMRRANTAILKENHPLPCMDHLLPKIRKAQYFSKLDIKNAFHQIELHPNSRHLTTFITSSGLYRYKRLMFLSNLCARVVPKNIRENADKV
ncbi:uncharacterized protein LOC125489811 [Plutella xylostella]|uniref:uncharacterized protein LOC125489811 n=1 Tax=Plutella xylostella TaxID=51655 RepID=UPI0020329DF1|nr:uncharacterized protein LOC125489811 [Plutella xylostella]